MLYVMLSVAQDWLSDPTQLHFCARAEHKTLKGTGPRENITKGGRTYTEYQMHCDLR